MNRMRYILNFELALFKRAGIICFIYRFALFWFKRHYGGSAVLRYGSYMFIPFFYWLTSKEHCKNTRYKQHRQQIKPPLFIEVLFIVTRYCKDSTSNAKCKRYKRSSYQI